MLSHGNIPGASPFSHASATRLRRREQPVLDVGHPQLAPLQRFVDEPHRARMALALFDHRLAQCAEEALDVGFPNQ